MDERDATVAEAVAEDRRAGVMFAAIRAAKARSDDTVEIEWGDGSRSVVDLAATIEKGGVFAALADKDFFVNCLSIGDDGDWLAWLGDIDFSADSLWYRSHPEEEVGDAAAGS